ncbi:hypothetical protein M5W78_03885 [Paenibacillus larvae]|uniref:hypothetical protein n=1 Tax=Paenibacillus larvae TaxID=1464 RepID=UPI00227F42DE|nr:hypothetical protein [Paenibacillus larvae]MCY9509152.1 hypothetical protein [Paenibacillus larvae]
MPEYSRITGMGTLLLTEGESGTRGFGKIPSIDPRLDKEIECSSPGHIETMLFFF